MPDWECKGCRLGTIKEKKKRNGKVLPSSSQEAEFHLRAWLFLQGVCSALIPSWVEHIMWIRPELSWTWNYNVPLTSCSVAHQGLSLSTSLCSISRGPQLGCLPLKDILRLCLAKSAEDLSFTCWLVPVAALQSCQDIPIWACFGTIRAFFYCRDNVPNETLSAV